jgi:CBS-domain-containing membrane protein
LSASSSPPFLYRLLPLPPIHTNTTTTTTTITTTTTTTTNITAFSRPPRPLPPPPAPLIDAGLRHLAVLGPQMALVGVVTRSDLTEKHAEDSLQRMFEPGDVDDDQSLAGVRANLPPSQ